MLLLPLKSCLNSDMLCLFARSQFPHSERAMTVPTSPQWLTLRVKLGNATVADTVSNRHMFLLLRHRIYKLWLL